MHKFFIKEYKCIEKEKKVIRYITDDLELFSDDSNEEESSFNKCVKKLNYKLNSFKLSLFLKLSLRLKRSCLQH